MEYTLFGKEHIILLIISIAFIIISNTLLNKFTRQSEKRIKISFIIIYSLILLSEIAKQIHGYITYGEVSIGYYPFHICSYALYFFPFVAFKKQYPKRLMLTATILGIIPGLVTIFYPSNVLQGGFVTANSFFYHSLMIIFGIQILSSGIYHYRPKDFIYTLLSIVVIFSIALTANTIFKGADFAFIGTGGSAPYGEWFISKFGKALYVTTVYSLFSFIVFLFQLPYMIGYVIKNKTLHTIRLRNNSI
ncbi:YwaF family protein [Acholeplasma hippikon]|uniref:Predicted integral membrane protein n=1 Tax=Acholeplasma hippikon TaxID=264636 RepID=A0A449BJ30_9MOLU|nr:YwaF family protein [Acholeplasma hippikon]VEU82327.1 Predicted integral membrane protein [Acholeplasma hippikon]